jgi:hypothetical protein
MKMNTEAFMALLGIGEGKSLARTMLTVPGEAATFIAMLSIAGKAETPAGGGKKPRA